MAAPTATPSLSQKTFLIKYVLDYNFYTVAGREAKTDSDPDYELTPNDTYGISIEIAPEESSDIHAEADGIKPIPNTVYGVSQGGDHLMQEVCSKLGDGDGTSVLSAYVTMEPNVYDTIDCLKQI